MKSRRDDALAVPLSAPDVGEAEIEAVARVLRGRRLSLGPRLADFERAMARQAGTAHAVGVSSGTAGLHLCVRALGIGEGDEVITTPFSFVATANAVLYERARPVFADVDPETLNIDPLRVERAITGRTRAILAVHVFGLPAAMGPLAEIARRHDLSLIEDACEALGATLGGRAVGGLGDAGVFGFYPNKQITTGEGGMIVTDRAPLADRARSLRNQGRAGGEGHEHVELGWNYRLSELHAALGEAQLRRLPEILGLRRRAAAAYARRLAGNPDLVLPAEAGPGTGRSWFVYVVRLADRFDGADRDAIAAGLVARGIGCGRYFPPIHLQPFYRELLGHRPGDFPAAERAAARTLALPFFNRITEEQIDRVATGLEELIARRK